MSASGSRPYGRSPKKESEVTARAHGSHAVAPGHTGGAWWRRAAVALALALLATGLAAPSASAEDPAPSAKELWESYPLTQPQTTGPKSTGPQATGPTSTVTSSTRSVGPGTAAEHGADPGGGLPWVAIAVVVFCLAAAATTLLTLRRRRPAWGPADAPPIRPRSGPPRLYAVRDEVQRMTPDSPRPPSIAPAASPPDLACRWVAEIVWDEAADDPMFRAVARSEGASDEAVVAQSGRVEWPPKGTSAVDDMRTAVDELEATLLHAGWSPHGRGRAWYARRFAWQPLHVAPSAAPSAAPAVAQRATTPADFEQRWRCEIRWSAGYVNSNFVVVRYAPGHRRGSDIGASVRFRWMFMNDPDPRLSGDRAALRELCDALVATGWEPAGRGHAWYAERFVWAGGGEPPDHLDPATAPPVEGKARWRCEIAWRSGATGPRFVGLMSEPSKDRRRRIVSSPALKRTLGDPDPRLQEHKAAVAQVAATLIAAGWEPVARGGGPWYAQRFVWPRDTPPPSNLTPAIRQGRVAPRPVKGAS